MSGRYSDLSPFFVTFHHPISREALLEEQTYSSFGLRTIFILFCWSLPPIIAFFTPASSGFFYLCIHDLCLFLLLPPSDGRGNFHVASADHLFLSHASTICSTLLDDHISWYQKDLVRNGILWCGICETYFTSLVKKYVYFYRHDEFPCISFLMLCCLLAKHWLILELEKKWKERGE